MVAGRTQRLCALSGTGTNGRNRDIHFWTVALSLSLPFIWIAFTSYRPGKVGAVRPFRTCIPALVFVFCAAPSFADSLYWYTGDSDQTNNLLNETGGAHGTAFVYDHFVVAPAGVNISGVFSDNVVLLVGTEAQPTDTNLPNVVTQADWQIRSGVSQGNAGTLVASGSGSAASQTDTGFTSTGYDVYRIQVSGLNVFLETGDYWLGVAPVMSSTDYYSFIVTTVGANSVGIHDGNSFFDWPSNGNYNFVSAGAVAPDFVGPSGNFSMGIVTGTDSAAPEPGTAALIGGGISLLLLRARARHRSRLAITTTSNLI